MGRDLCGEGEGEQPAAGERGEGEGAVKQIRIGIGSKTCIKLG